MEGGTFLGTQIQWKLGDGNLINFWQDVWLGNHPLQNQYISSMSCDCEKNCANYWDFMQGRR